MKLQLSLIVPILLLLVESVQATQLDKIEHIIVIYLENHSFDNLYGTFPGAEGVAQASPQQSQQIDSKGNPYQTLPEVPKDKRFPSNLPNQPFEINQFVAPNEKTRDLVHRFYQHQAQINEGKMNRFVVVSDAGALTMGHYRSEELPLWSYAKRFTLADNFFQSAYGGSFLNHQWLICACTPRYENAPERLKVQLNEQGELIKDGAVTPDNFVVNTLQPIEQPSDAKEVDVEKHLPLQTAVTIGDRLSDQSISWAWFAGGWDDAVAGHPAENFQYHHQPFVYFKNYAQGTTARELHLKDEADFLKGIEEGHLPAVSFYKPIGDLNEHPGYSDLLSGEQHIAEILHKIEQSAVWKSSVVIVTYDEFGGFWDHVPPPKLDRWGAGNRVPALIISPFAKPGYVDHTMYESTSILKLIETRFNLLPLTERDTKATPIHF
jgi:phospholipase C